MAAEFGGSMAREDPLVSVILPTYNQAEYLREAVESVLAQVYEAWELIVIDDGSRDGSLTYLSGVTHPRVRVIRDEHCANPAKLRNIGVAEAGGEYVAFLDSDDLWMSRKLEIQIGSLKGHATARWSYSNYDRIDELGNEMSNASWRPHSGWILEELITFGAMVAMPTVVVERGLFDEAGGFDETLRYCEDYDLWFRLATLSEVLAIPQPLSKVRSYSQSYTRDRLGVNRSWIVAYQKLASTGDRRIRELCRRRSAEVMLALAKRSFTRGQRLRALKEMARAFRYDPLSAKWWRGLLGAFARSVGDHRGS